jgi:ParB family chromosome partitioning protein
MKVIDVPIERIIPSPYNPRHSAEQLEGLADSIKSVGIIEPLIVAVCLTDPNSVEIVAGFRRFSAAKLAGLKKVPCQLLPAVGERAERTISLVENLHRKEMSPIEMGEAFNALIATGMTQMQVAKATGTSDYTVSIKTTLVNRLIPEFQNQVHLGVMTQAEGLKMAKLPRDAQLARFTGTPSSNPNKTPMKRRPHCEAALMAALRLYRDGHYDLALAEVRRALGYLENRAEAAA